MTSAPDTSRLLQDAMAQHQSGQFQQAEGLYRQVLSADPRQVIALRYLGILLHQTGRHAAAADMLGQAIAQDGSDADTHHNMGSILQVLGRLDEAAAHYAQVIALNPGAAEAHYEIGNLLARQDRDADAAAAYRRALDVRPNLVQALINLGSVLLKQGRADEAAARWNEALAVHPQNPVASMNLALMLKQQGKLEEAAAQLRGIAAAHPRYADAHYNLGGTLQTLGQWDSARDAYRSALTSNPGHFKALNALVALLLAEGNIAEALQRAIGAISANENDETRSVLAVCLASPALQPSVGDLRAILVRALTDAWVQPAVLAATAARFLSFNQAINDAIVRADAAWPNVPPAAELTAGGGMAALTGEPLLHALLETGPLPSLALERFATALRTDLLTAAEASEAVSEPVLRLYCAVARQSYINSYVFAQSEAEARRAGALRDGAGAALQAGAFVAPLTLVAVAAYFPLAGLPGNEVLLQRTWPEAVGSVVQQQVAAPAEEQRLRASMPSLTAIEPGVSSAVREQYEESPYPQWTKMPLLVKPQTVDACFRQTFPLAPLAPASGSDGPEVLVAGCGTGRHSIQAAGRFRNARVLAVDLSLTSLAYAQRQTRALGIGNIEYAQADIANLPALGRSFDVIESVGVLHHLADPFGGWRALVSMLRPGGLMLIGLYSEIARQNLKAARDFIAERGYRDDASGIRRFRQDYIQHGDDAGRNFAVSMLDFFSLSECRDMLFHRQEHRTTLPGIAAFLAENGLQFLGFDLDLQHRLGYARQFPNDTAMTDLAQWHRYETDNPRTFTQMYQFWVQKTR